MPGLNPMALPQEGDRNLTGTYLLQMVFYAALACALYTLQVRYVLQIPTSPLQYLLPAGVGLLFGYLIARLKVLREKQEKLASSDNLTGLMNRMRFNEYLIVEADRATRYKKAFSLILMDIDNFKKVNDIHGHQAGDAVLAEFADLLRKGSRATDIAARWGDQEFLLLLPETGLEGAQVQAERLRRGLLKKDFGPAGQVTASFGVARFRPGEDTPDSFFSRADQALDQAKAEGRNRIVLEDEA